MVKNTFQMQTNCKSNLRHLYVKDMDIADQLTRYFYFEGAFPSSNGAQLVYVSAQEGLTQESIEKLDYFDLLGAGHVFSERFVNEMSLELGDDITFEEVYLRAFNIEYKLFIARINKKINLLDYDSMNLWKNKTGSKKLIFHDSFDCDFLIAKESGERKSVVSVSDDFVNMCKSKKLKISYSKNIISKELSM